LLWCTVQDLRKYSAITVFFRVTIAPGSGKAVLGGVWPFSVGGHSAIFGVLHPGCCNAQVHMFSTLMLEQDSPQQRCNVRQTTKIVVIRFWCFHRKVI
jgi:hypothetical protein